MEEYRRWLLAEQKSSKRRVQVRVLTSEQKLAARLRRAELSRKRKAEPQAVEPQALEPLPMRRNGQPADSAVVPNFQLLAEEKIPSVENCVSIARAVRAAVAEPTSALAEALREFLVPTPVAMVQEVTVHQGSDNSRKVSGQLSTPVPGGYILPVPAGDGLAGQRDNTVWSENLGVLDRPGFCGVVYSTSEVARSLHEGQVNDVCERNFELCCAELNVRRLESWSKMFLSEVFRPLLLDAVATANSTATGYGEHCAILKGDGAKLDPREMVSGNMWETKHGITKFVTSAKRGSLRWHRMLASVASAVSWFRRAPLPLVHRASLPAPARALHHRS